MMFWHLWAFLVLERLPSQGEIIPRDGRWLPSQHTCDMQSSQSRVNTHTTSFYQASAIQDTISLPRIIPGSSTRQLGTTLRAQHLPKLFSLPNTKCTQLPTLECPFLPMKTTTRGLGPRFALCPFCPFCLLTGFPVWPCVPCPLFLGTCEYKSFLSSWQSFLHLPFLPYLIKTNSRYILIRST